MKHPVSDVGLDHDSNLTGPTTSEGFKTFSLTNESIKMATKQKAFSFTVKCAATVFVFHIAAAYYTERVFLENRKVANISALYSILELAVMALGTIVNRKAHGLRVFDCNAPMWNYAVLGLLYLASRWISYTSMEYIDFRTQVSVSYRQLQLIAYIAYASLNRSYICPLIATVIPHLFYYSI